MTTKFTCTVITAVTLSLAANAQNSWKLNGNSNATSNDFIGTKNKVAFKIRTNNLVRMTINTNGNIGIGTTAPNSALDVAGTITAFDSYFGKRFPLSAGTSGASYSSVGYGLTFTDTTANYRYRISDYSSMLSFKSGGFDFNTAPAGITGNIIPYTTAMRINQNGTVGIGDPNLANYKLYVVDSRGLINYPVVNIENTQGSAGAFGLQIKAGSNIATGANFIIYRRPDGLAIGATQQTNLSGVSYLTTSDKRLKNINGTTQKGLTDLMKIKIYDYSFKTDANKQVQTGFMAQELYEIFPQAVSKPRNNNEPAEKDPWMVDYGKVTPLIIKAVQEQQQMIDELKKQNEKLQKQIDELKSLLISKGNTKIEDKQTAFN